MERKADIGLHADVAGGVNDNGRRLVEWDHCCPLEWLAGVSVVGSLHMYTDLE